MKRTIYGDWTEGSYVTVEIDGKVITRKVRYSARKWADLYITADGKEYAYDEFDRNTEEDR